MVNVKQTELSVMIGMRDKILDINYDDKEADVLEQKILTVIKTDFDELPIEFIIETLTKLGQGPNLVYDDNGNFAVSGNAFQPVVVDAEKIEGGITVFVEAQQWKETIRLALKFYLDEQN